MKEKTISILMEESKKDLVTEINNNLERYNLPIYLFEFIIRDIYNEILGLKNKQIVEDKTIIDMTCVSTKGSE